MLSEAWPYLLVVAIAFGLIGLTVRKLDHNSNALDAEWARNAVRPYRKMGNQFDCFARDGHITRGLIDCTLVELRTAQFELSHILMTEAKLNRDNEWSRGVFDEIDQARLTKEIDTLSNLYTYFTIGF